jgi:hypothetical protein
LLVFDDVEKMQARGMVSLQASHRGIPQAQAVKGRLMSVSMLERVHGTSACDSIDIDNLCTRESNRPSLTHWGSMLRASYVLSRQLPTYIRNMEHTLRLNKDAEHLIVLVLC